MADNNKDDNDYDDDNSYILHILPKITSYLLPI